MTINRITLITVILLLFRTMAFSQDNTAKYIEKHKLLAVNLMQEYSIPASVILGIALVESGAGTSNLSVKFHNHFGIIGKNFNAKKKLGYHSHYKEYKNDSASFRHFCSVIAQKPFYGKLRNNPDPEMWISSIRKAGYAKAAATWEKRVNIAIVKYNLADIDQLIDPLNETAMLK